MSLAGPVSTNIHQIGQSLAWCILYDVGVLFINLRHNTYATNLHSLMGWCILILTYIDILIFLIPNGFNITIQADSLLLYIHGIIGLCMMAFVVAQVAGGVLIRMHLTDKASSLTAAGKVKKGHRVFGYFLALIYKINVIWSWVPTYSVMGALVLWEIAFISAIVYLKAYRPKLEGTVTDRQLVSKDLPRIESGKDLESLPQTYVIFANNVYSAQKLVKHHPGGARVIETVLGREVDRFLYGMYSSQLLPELPPYSHSASCLQFAGPPIARLFVTPTYEGYTAETQQVSIGYVRKISQKTQIYELGLASKQSRLSFIGYSTTRQLGQYYSLTIDDRLTRLYTAVNFLNSRNIALMLELAKELRSAEVFKGRTLEQGKKRDTEMSEVKGKGKGMQEGLMSKGEGGEGHYLPIMMKIYANGKMTSTLKGRSFELDNLKVSYPRGRGLELESTEPGKIIVLAGGTGLFPFCDLIDLLFKADLLHHNHELSPQILKQNPVLSSKPFSKYSFLFLIAINEPEDIHPITLHQLLALSHSQAIRIVMRVSKNSEAISSLKSRIEFTRDYFTQRVLTESESKDLARVWICGPPKLSSETAAALLQAGHKRQSFLLV